MIYHVILYKVDKSVDDSTLDFIIRETRTQLLKIGEILSLKCGKNIDQREEWPFFIALELESTSKMHLFYQDPNYIKFNRDVIEKYTIFKVPLTYELDPNKNTKYS